MNKLLKVTLITAIMATSGMADDECMGQPDNNPSCVPAQPPVVFSADMNQLSYPGLAHGQQPVIFVMAQPQQQTVAPAPSWYDTLKKVATTVAYGAIGLMANNMIGRLNGLFEIGDNYHIPPVIGNFTGNKTRTGS